jgi:hypothetical protein
MIETDSSWPTSGSDGRREAVIAASSQQYARRPAACPSVAVGRRVRPIKTESHRRQPAHRTRTREADIVGGEGIAMSTSRRVQLDNRCDADAKPDAFSD